MQGKNDKQQSIFQYMTLEQLVPANYFLRKIDQAVDFSFVREVVSPLYSPDRGRPSVDPEVALRMMTLSYLLNLSENRTCAEIKMHAGYLWFCGLDFNTQIPDRTTLVKLRKQWRKAGLFKQIFIQVVEQCIKAGFVRGELLAVDGTTVKARAAINSLEEINPIPLQDYLLRLEAEDDDEPPEDPKTPRKGGEPDFRGEKFTNETHRSVTDPEARLFRKSKGQEAKLSYLAHNLIDVKSRVIISAMATPANISFEREAALEMLRETTPLLPPSVERKLLADGNYIAAEFLAKLLDIGYKPLVPIEGELEPIPAWKTKTKLLDRYRKRQHKVKLVKARNQAKLLRCSREYRRTYRYRARIEHIFAEAKEHHGLRTARSYGLACIKEQVLMTAAVQNMKRLATYVWRRGKKAAKAMAATLSFFVNFVKNCFSCLNPGFALQ
ncbi:MAG: IS5 family transposase [Firmicutes bacterium]|nr:IS5 family transposase [Bacillota bacterium]